MEKLSVTTADYMAYNAIAMGSFSFVSPANSQLTYEIKRTEGKAPQFSLMTAKDYMRKLLRRR